MNAQDVVRLRLSYERAVGVTAYLTERTKVAGGPSFGVLDWLDEARRDEQEAYQAWQDAVMAYAERAGDSVQDQRDNFIRRDRPTGAQDTQPGDPS